MSLTEQEKIQLQSIESNLKFLNSRHPLEAITIKKYIAGGNRIDLLIGTHAIALGLTVEQACYAVMAICNYDLYSYYGED